MRRILIVDDEVSYCELLKDVFTEQGYKVRTASRSQEAMTVAATFIPDVVIVDWMLHDEDDGSAVAAICREVNPHVGVVFVSGYPNHTVQSAAETDASLVWLAKPFHLDEVVTAVTTLCDPSSSGGTSHQLE